MPQRDRRSPGSDPEAAEKGSIRKQDAVHLSGGRRFCIFCAAAFAFMSVMRYTGIRQKFVDGENDMKSQITMKDLAQHFGVSLNTVHKAINGKPGISEATRKMILEYADAHGYQMNTAASLLKKKSVTVALCLPELDETSRYFYDDIRLGALEYVRSHSDLKVQVVEFAHKKDSLSRKLAEIGQAVEDGLHLDGLLTSPPEDKKGILAIHALAEKGITVQFVIGDNQSCPRLGTVMADYDAAGQIMAEQLCNILTQKSRVLLMAGSPHVDAHQRITSGFESYLQRFAPDCTVEKLYGYYDIDQLRTHLISRMTKQTPDAVCCIFGWGSAILAGALHETGLAGTLPAIDAPSLFGFYELLFPFIAVYSILKQS